MFKDLRHWDGFHGLEQANESTDYEANLQVLFEGGLYRPHTAPLP